MATMVDDSMLTLTDEALLVGRDKGLISRRRASDPSHPVNQPGSDVVRIGTRRHRRAPASAVTAYWERQPKPGRPATTPRAPGGLTAAQWRALRAIAAGTPPTVVARRKLITLGLLTEENELTSAGRGIIDANTEATDA
jgi:hypothetical protein